MSTPAVRWWWAPSRAGWRCFGLQSSLPLQQRATWGEITGGLKMLLDRSTVREGAGTQTSNSHWEGGVVYPLKQNSSSASEFPGQNHILEKNRLLSSGYLQSGGGDPFRWGVLQVFAKWSCLKWMKNQIVDYMYFQLFLFCFSLSAFSSQFSFSIQFSSFHCLSDFVLRGGGALSSLAINLFWGKFFFVFKF